MQIVNLGLLLGLTTITLTTLGCETAQPAVQTSQEVVSIQTSAIQGTAASPKGRGVGFHADPAASAVFAHGIVTDETNSEGTHRRLTSSDAIGRFNLKTGAFEASPFSIVAGRGSEGIKDPNEHNQRVFDYFSHRGFPTDQVVETYVTTMGVGEASATGLEGPRRFVSYYSHLRRSIEGIDVPESYAWARIDVAGQVVAEGVYWPTVPESVIETAKRMKATTSTPEGLRRMLGKANLPSEYATATGGARVVIHHTIGSWEGDEIQFVASLDIGEGGKSLTSRPRVSLDESGRRIVLNHSRWPLSRGARAPIGR